MTIDRSIIHSCCRIWTDCVLQDVIRIGHRCDCRLNNVRVVGQGAVRGVSVVVHRVLWKENSPFCNMTSHRGGVAILHSCHRSSHGSAVRIGKAVRRGNTDILAESDSLSSLEAD